MMEKITLRKNKLLFLFVLSFVTVDISAARKEEADALLKWKNSLTNYSRSVASSWSLANGPNNIPCNWARIQCDHFGGIIEIHLFRSSLKGTLYQFNFTAFPNLTYLNLYGNNLFGEIPIQIGSLSKLTLLELRYNNFTGTIPSEIGNLSELSDLRLSHNSLTGTIPLQFFTGLIKLEWLRLGFNKLTGKIPNEIGLLSNLQLLHLSNNMFNIGPIPSTIGNLKMLQEIHLSGIGLNSNIPKELGFCPNLSVIDFSFNNLSGPFPLSMASLTKLYWIKVDNNQLSGKIHPHFLSNWTQLEHLNLNNNNFIGAIPSEIGNCTMLYFLKFSENKLIREIPESICNLTSLEILQASHNKLEGHVPRCLANCKYLRVLDLGHNVLHDTFPFWLEMLPSLQVLILRYNMFYGPIEPLLRANHGFQKLLVLDISSNEFTGNLPTEYFRNWKAMIMVVVNQSKLEYIEKNKFYDISITISYKGQDMTLPKIVTTFASVDLSNNRFEGGIPEVIGDLKSLKLLNLSHNDLTGHIPASLGNLTQLESLDLSQNKLSGEIPQQLLFLTFLQVMNLSQNHLVGSIPQGKQFDTFSNTSYEGNLGLCGPPLSKKCKSVDEILPPRTTFQQHEDSTSSSSDFDWKFMLVGCGFGLVIGIALGYTMFWKENGWLTKTFEPKRRRG